MWLFLFHPVNFCGEYMDSFPNILRYPEEHRWPGTLCASAGSFLGAISFYVSICEDVLESASSLSKDEQKCYCACAFVDQVPDGIIVLDCASSLCNLFKANKGKRAVAMKYLIFCGAQKKKMALIIFKDIEYAPLCFFQQR